jgi:hypothetical protein
MSNNITTDGLKLITDKEVLIPQSDATNTIKIRIRRYEDAE